jgi:hypothetical protein
MSAAALRASLAASVALRSFTMHAAGPDTR